MLDLAAAPGGKTSHIAALMGNSGRIAAVDSARPRFFRLLRTLEQLGVTNAGTYLRDGAGVWKVRPGALRPRPARRPLLRGGALHDR